MSEINISICIPAYKRAHFLKRLLESIIIQTYQDFELIITDDSDDNSVSELVNDYLGKVNIRYFKNEKPLGTPANWNFAISQANGEWIKLMHDDDWFASSDSLYLFAEQIKEGNKFIFSAYANFFESDFHKQNVFVSKNSKQRIINSPVSLLAENIIGPPSVTLVHKSIGIQYDERMKWFVDLDFYIRVLMREETYGYIDKVLINVGVSESQVTNYCFNIPSVVLPEGYLLLKKYTLKPLRNIIVFDAWWRIIRNSNVTSRIQLQAYGQKDWPKVILNIVRIQSLFSNKILKIGVVSKFLMCNSYFINLIQSNI